MWANLTANTLGTGDRLYVGGVLWRRTFFISRNLQLHKAPVIAIAWVIAPYKRRAYRLILNLTLLVRSATENGKQL
jgi:hypothetical protein